ncbi:MAG: hypothetical protein ABIR04_00775 [Cypionkella sp.]
MTGEIVRIKRLHLIILGAIIFAFGGATLWVKGKISQRAGKAASPQKPVSPDKDQSMRSSSKNAAREDFTPDTDYSKLQARIRERRR